MDLLNVVASCSVSAAWEDAIKCGRAGEAL